MSDILTMLAEHARYRVKESQKVVPFEEIRDFAEMIPAPELGFKDALAKPGMSFICEVKKASPSKGVIAEHFPYLEIAKDYERAGADAISVLTEPKWFLGSESYLEEISEAVSVPIIRKDFTVDPYMIFEAKAIGASAVLLIVSILGADKLKEYLTISKELGLSALVECHDEEEIEIALDSKAEIIGVNNRNLRDFSVDVNNAGRLRKSVPEGVLFVSESGMKNEEDVKAAIDSGADAVLIGEALMRADDRRTFLQRLKNVK